MCDDRLFFKLSSIKHSPAYMYLSQLECNFNHTLIDLHTTCQHIHNSRVILTSCSMFPLDILSQWLGDVTINGNSNNVGVIISE